MRVPALARLAVLIEARTMPWITSRFQNIPRLRNSNSLTASLQRYKPATMLIASIHAVIHDYSSLADFVPSCDHASPRSHHTVYSPWPQRRQNRTSLFQKVQGTNTKTRTLQHERRLHSPCTKPTTTDFCKRKTLIPANPPSAAALPSPPSFFFFFHVLVHF